MARDALRGMGGSHQAGGGAARGAVGAKDGTGAGQLVGAGHQHQVCSEAGGQARAAAAL